MKSGITLFAVTLICGLVAGVVRALELAHAFDNATQLMISWHPATIILLALTGLFVVAAIWLASRAPKYEHGEPNPPSAAWMAVEVVACLLLLFSCGYELFQLREKFHAVLLIFNLLGALAAVSILTGAFYTRRGTLTASTGFYYTVPIFWCCFSLVLDFWSHSANPVLLSFVFVMFSLIFSSLAVHSVAGFFFGRPRQRRALAYCALGVFFSLMTLISLILYPYFETPGVEFIKVAVSTPSNIAKIGFMVLHVGALFYAVLTGGLRQPKPAALPEDADSPEPFSAHMIDEPADDAEDRPAGPDVPETDGFHEEAP